MLLEAVPQDLISLLTLRDATVIGILISLLIGGYRYFSSLVEKVEKKLEEKNSKIEDLIKKYDEKIDDLRDKYDDELKELRKEQISIIEKISTLISENTKVLQEVSTELIIKRRKNGQNI